MPFASAHRLSRHLRLTPAVLSPARVPAFIPRCRCLPKIRTGRFAAGHHLGIELGQTPEQTRSRRIMRQLLVNHDGRHARSRTYVSRVRETMPTRRQHVYNADPIAGLNRLRVQRSKVAAQARIPLSKPRRTSRSLALSVPPIRLMSWIEIRRHIPRIYNPPVVGGVCTKSIKRLQRNAKDNPSDDDKSQQWTNSHSSSSTP